METKKVKNTNIDVFNKNYNTFFRCINPFLDFKRGECYWFERLKSGKYCVLSDNVPQIKWKKYSITDKQFNNNFIIAK